MPCHHKAVQNHDIKIANESFKNQDCSHGLNMRNACHHLVHHLLSFHILSKNMKIKIYKTVILLVGLYHYDV